MPNHITNYVEIKGQADVIAKLITKTLKSNDEGVEFDFNGIIPMPTELQETVSPVEVVATREEAIQKNQEYVESGRAHGETVKYISQAEAQRRVDDYGELPGVGPFRSKPVLTWYEWAVKYWGTKWGAYGASVLKQESGRLVIQFDTAWSPPTPIFDKLVEMGFEVNCMWQDEDESNFGHYGEPWDVFERRIEYDFIG